jgi:magnesium-protoporphyrin O-methyltransferase
VYGVNKKERRPAEAEQSEIAMLLVGGSSAVKATAPRGLSRSRLVVAVDDKAEVKEYFNNEGFNRWSRIYSENAEVNKVQLDIRNGHAQTVDKVLAWVDSDGSAKAGETFCDAGCGVGSLALPLAERGATVCASDISAAMVKEAETRAVAAGLSDRIAFAATDLEQVEGEFDSVTCIDVLIHYPQDKMADMVLGLAKKAKSRVIISFAPDTWYYRALKKIGELAPGPSKTTRAYLHTEEAVVAALERAGFTIARTEMTGTSFYFSRLLEATRV